MDTASKPQNAGAGPCALLPHHLAALRARGLSDSTITAAGLRSETSRDKLATLLNWKRAGKTLAPAIVIPFTAADGSNGYARVRPDVPRKDRNGKAVKYESPCGQPNHVFLPPGVASVLQNESQEIAITEGEFKALALTQELLPTIGITGIRSWQPKGEQRLLPALEAVAWSGREVYLVPDSDVATNDNVSAAIAWLAKHLTDRGAKVSMVRLPDGPPDHDGKPTKLGVDDWIAGQQGDRKAALRALLNAAEDPPPVDAESLKENAAKLDPADEAEWFLATGKQDGVYRLRFWRGGWHLWIGGRYVELPPSEVRARLVVNLNQHYHHLTTGITGNVLDQLKAQALLSFGHEPPCWLEPVAGCENWQPDDCLVARNGIVHLPSLVSGRPAIEPATPRFFTPTALDFQFDIDALRPDAWLGFLEQLWPDDPDSIATLQEWCGYCLTPDTRQQKMLLLVGPRRSGKGTIARVLRAVVGEANVAGPSLASLGTNFGLWPLLGKTLSIVSDARLSGRTDQAIVVERLLSITGEDALTVDRKNLEPVTGKLLTRLMILTNELPRLGDASGALSGRMIMLRMSESFYGREDIALTDKLLTERPGILLWAIEGWRRLRERGCFIQPASGDDLRQQMEDIASPVGEFVRDRCDVGAGYDVSVELIYAAWRAWCEDKGREPSTEQIFGRDLTAAVPSIRRTRPRDGDRRYRAYDGIKLHY